MASQSDVNVFQNKISPDGKLDDTKKKLVGSASIKPTKNTKKRASLFFQIIVLFHSPKCAFFIILCGEQAVVLIIKLHNPQQTISHLNEWMRLKPSIDTLCIA